MSAMLEALRLLSLATPLVYAVATYQLFHWLERNASAQVKMALSGLVSSRNYDEKTVTTTIVEIFDRINIAPLLSLHAMERSTIIILIVNVALILSGQFDLSHPSQLHLIAASLATNVASGYLSLFAIRGSIVNVGDRMWLILLVGLLLGAFVVGIFTAVLLFEERYGLGEWLGPVIDDGQISQVIGLQLAHSAMYSIPALFAQLWLPLFVFGLICMKGIHYFLRAVQSMQWFLKRGDEHPLDAIGYVAGAVVFAMSITVRLISF
jgi:hypothetical protein